MPRVTSAVLRNPPNRSNFVGIADAARFPRHWHTGYNARVRKIGSNLGFIVILAALACGADTDAPDEQSTPKSSKGPQSISIQKAEPKPADSLLRERRAALDETIWKDETAAQEFEATFVRLWDEMRGSRDAIAVLSAFPFFKLTLGAGRTSESLDLGITHWGDASNTRDLEPGDWRKLLADFQQGGWELIQSEWHHSRFVPSESGPTQSEFGIVLHAQNSAEQRRAIIAGTIRVEWSAEQDSHGHWLVGAIDASALEIWERRGLPAFSESQELAPKSLLDLAAADADLRGSVLVYDLNGDSLDEIVVASANKVFWNRGSWKFEERPLLAQPPFPGLETAVLADFTGDGVVDLLGVGLGGWPTLYAGGPGGEFPGPGKKIKQVGERLIQPTAIAVGDIDGDGDLDAWLADYKKPYYQGKEMPEPYFDANNGFASHLLVNLGAGEFSNATETAGLSAKRYRRTYSTSFIDLDDDGDLDLVVVSDFSGADVYLNDGTGHFTDATDRMLDERTSFGMAGLFSDFNLDALLDFYMVGMSSTTARRLDRLGLGRSEFPEHQKMRSKMGFGNRLYLGGADHSLREADLGNAVVRTGWSWGTTAFDFDLDADPDIYVANGHLSRTTAEDYCSNFWTHDIYSEEAVEGANVGMFLADAKETGVSWNGFEHNRLLMNIDGQRFIETGFLMGVAVEQDSRMVVSGDFDADGHPDLLVSTREFSEGGAAGKRDSRIWLKRNTLSHDRHWIGIRLAGPRSPIGARIAVVSGDRQQLHYVVTGDGYLSQQPPARVFGLGQRDSVDYVLVTYPGGTEVRIETPPVDRYHVISDSPG
jgi:hypothetical protein